MANKSSKASLAGRTIVALLLFAGFYVLAIALAGGLILVPVLGFKLGHTHFLLLVLDLLCLGAAALILWSIFPKREPFREPGPRLTRESDPRLFDEIIRIARRSDHPAPAVVYLTSDTTAGVAETGGFLGFGRRRFAMVGLALLAALSVNELRAVLAHEFWHFRGGDSRLGPWVYRTRAAIERALRGLPVLGGSKRFPRGLRVLIALPFVLFGNWFLRITQAISRRQEYLADGFSVEIVGRETTVSALRRTFLADLAYRLYWQSPLGPALNAGFLPPVAAGLGTYIEGQKELLLKALIWEIENGRSGPHDSHPSLGERIKALDGLAAEVGMSSPLPAVSLLENVPGREKELFAILNPEAGPKLKPIDWDDVGATVLFPLWAELTRENRAVLAGLTPMGFPDGLAGFADRCRQSVGTSGPSLTENEAKSLAIIIAGAAIVTKMIERGWEASYALGQYTIVRQMERSWEPFRSLNALAGGEITAEEWRRVCGELGIGDLELGAVPPTTEACRGAGSGLAARAGEVQAPAPESPRPAGMDSYVWFILATLIIGMLSGVTRMCDSGETFVSLPNARVESSGPGRASVPGKESPRFGLTGPGQPLSMTLRQGGLVTRVIGTSSRARSYGATVEVVNESSKSYNFIMVRVEFCDHAGRVISTLMSDARRDDFVPPGGRKTFTVSGSGGLIFATVRASVAYSAEVK